jgi:AcrR family transcriptional regulator
MGSVTERDATPSTRERLLATAQTLLARHGIDGVSLREITRQSGARNVRALQYHFTDRTGLVRAVLEPHLADVDACRHTMLDGLDADAAPHPGGPLRPLAAALVRPYAAKLTDGSGGPEFLRIYADAVSRPTPLLQLSGLLDADSSLNRWRLLVERRLDADAVRLHRRFMVIQYAISELARRAGAERGGDHALFTSSLVDNVAAMLEAAPSEETRALLRRRRRSRFDSR